MLPDDNPRSYRGPVIYIVHGLLGLFFDKSVKSSNIEVRQAIANMDKIKEGLERAAVRSVPVVWEIEALEQQRLEKVVSGLKHKPKIVWVNKAQETKGALVRNQFQPTKFVFMGHYRDLCASNSVTGIRRDFPETDIYVVEGSATIYLRDIERYNYRKTFRDLNVRISRKLNRTHFA